MVKSQTSFRCRPESRNSAASSSLCYSFPPVAKADARVLILGSMPGEASLQAQQYYAHPRNSFWPIMMTLLGQESGLSYQQRTSVLQQHHIALWDVLMCCERSGSLDSAIRAEQANDFAGFFQRHPAIDAVFFNGAKAQQSFQRYVLPTLPEPHPHKTFIRLPSSSPAMATLNREQKLEQWQVLLDYLDG